MSSNRLYYHLKPYLPWRFRMALRRNMARWKRKAYGDVWPINEAAARTPADWPGWPDGRQFAFVLTHDVEGPAGLAKCRQLMQLEQELGFRSSFNFIPEGDYAVADELREELEQNGFEVGVHDLHHDGMLFNSREDFSKSVPWINRYLKKWRGRGFRSGFMLRNLDWLHELNIQYDASTFDTDPFEPQPDGAGTIFPFWVPRPATACRNGKGETVSASLPAHSPQPSEDGYVELPYTLPQDSTLFLLLREPTPAIWLRKLDWIAQHGGMALLNVHPDYLRFPGEPALPHTFPVEHYVQLLRHIAERHAGAYWHGLPWEIADSVKRHRMDSVIHGGTQEYQFECEAISLRQPVMASSSGHSSAVVAESSPATRTVAELIRKPEPVNQSIPAPGGTAGRDDSVPMPRLGGQRVAVLLYSHYPSDPRPRREAEALAREGAEVDFLCLQGNPSEPRRETVNGLNVFRVPLKHRRGSKLAYLYQYSAFISAAFGFLAWRSSYRRYDLVHVHNMPDILVSAALIPKLLGAKIILDLHDPMPELMMTIFKLPENSREVRLLKRVEKESIRFADLVLTPNLAFQRLFVSRGCPPEKIHIVMNSPNEDVFRLKPVSSEANLVPSAKPFMILYHGSLVARHGLDLAIDALEIVRKSIPQAVITVCGENTPYFEQVMDTVRKRGLETAVCYLGMRNRQQIVEAIEQCDVGVIPNRRSVFTEINMPTRIFEYLALGKPVVAPRTQGIQDYFGERDLIFFEPDDVADLAQKIAFAAGHPDEVQEMVRRGQPIYLQNRWQIQGANFIRLAAGLLGKNAENATPSRRG